MSILSIIIILAAIAIGFYLVSKYMIGTPRFIANIVIAIILIIFLLRIAGVIDSNIKI